MLKKLLKYDLQAMLKYAIPMSIFMLCYSFIATLFFRFDNIDNYESDITSLLIGLLILGFVLFMMAYSIIIQGIIVVNFYKSMVTDTGYLTHTLPVKKSTILLSKYISGILMVILTAIVTIISITVFFDIPRLWAIHSADIKDVLSRMLNEYSGAELALFTASMIVSVFISLIFSLSCYYLAIAIGQRVNRHKIVGSIVAYGILMIVLQIVMNIFVFFAPMDFLINEQEELLSLINTSLFFFASSLFIALLTAIMTFITHYFFTKKLNLD